MNGNPSVDLSVCICTFKRPALLETLLQAVARQAHDGRRLQIVVVDNDPQQSASAVLQAWQPRTDVIVTALHVSTPNIALARNAAVHAALADWIVFVDDDEEPDPQWLDKLVDAQKQYGADAVFGPVLPRYHARTPTWIRQGGYFDRPRYPTGTTVPVRDARTGNVLVRRAMLMSLQGPFDAAYGRTGGSDTVLFGALLGRRAKLIWCDEATVQEDVPPERATLEWILRRAFRGGQSFVRSDLKLLAPMRKLTRGLYLGARALAQLAIALACTLALFPFSRTRAVQWLRTAAAQAGKLTALAGHRYHEYGH